MISASRRLGALLAGGAAVVAFGLTGSAMAAGANEGCDAGAAHHYCPSGVGKPSGNGAGHGNGNNGNAWGKPGAGAVGNADAKNPPGQAPDGSDDNQGYECDGNSGVGKTNPAHSGCDGDGYPGGGGGYGDPNT